MLNYYSRALKSMWRNPRRLEGRSWLNELIARALKIILTSPENQDLTRLRKVIDSAGIYHPSVRKTTFEPCLFGDVPCKTIAPSDAEQTVLVYLHGGGYVFGSPKGYRGFLSQLAVHSKATVIAVDYRLSPEHPYPAAQDDALAATRAVFDQFSNCRKVIAGDSAGGALTIATALALNKDTDATQADACVLLSPWVDPWEQGGSMQSNAEHDYLTREWLEKSINHHLNGASTKDKLRFTDIDLSALPQTLVESGGGEVFHDQIIEFVERALSDGVAITHHIANSQVHVHPILSPLFNDARASVRRIADFSKGL